MGSAKDMEFAKDSRNIVYIRQEWPVADKGIWINRHREKNMKHFVVWFFLDVQGSIIYIYRYICPFFAGQIMKKYSFFCGAGNIIMKSEIPYSCHFWPVKPIWSLSWGSN